MIPLLSALAVLLLTLFAEWLHIRRIRAVGRLAFGPAGAPHRWTRVVPLLRPICLAAFAWGLATLLLLKLAEGKGDKQGGSQDATRLIFVADLSPSMYLPDAGPEGKQTRQARGEAALRTENLKAQATIASLLAENVDLNAKPWNQLVQIMAEFWMTEAENTFAQKTFTTSSKPKPVAPEDLLPTAPAGKWMAALPPSLRERFDVTLSKVILASANFDNAADRIVEIGKRNAEAGVALAEDFLTVWAQAHNPQLSEALRKKYSLADDARKRMTAYKERNLQAQDYFQRGADAYAKEMLKLASAEYSIEAHLGWFHGLLGIGSGGQINLSKAMNRAALTKLREHLLALPGKAAATHMSLFAKFVNARLADERDPLHEDLKYRYLASALVVTKDDPFTLGAEKKVAYFDELLSEIRLQTRVDGPNTVGRDQEFGIIVSIVHTEAMGRVAQFGQYLSNDPGTPNGKPKRRSPLVKKVRETQGARDELEQNLAEALAPFFDVKSITFATPEVKPRPTAKPGWEETILAYLLVRAKDASVDKIPPVELELKFIDLTGPVTIPASSAEMLIKVAAAALPRPMSKVEISQVLDTRQFAINGALALEIKATATGLVPELDQLLDLEALKKAVGIRQISPHEGLQVKELNTWGDQVTPRSERLWTLALDGDAIRAAEGATEIQFPSATA